MKLRPLMKVRIALAAIMAINWPYSVFGGVLSTWAEKLFLTTLTIVIVVDVYIDTRAALLASIDTKTGGTP